MGEISSFAEARVTFILTGDKIPAMYYFPQHFESSAANLLTVTGVVRYWLQFAEPVSWKDL